MTHHDLIVIGASAGGVEVLRQLVRGLPPGLPAAVCVVCHTTRTGPGLLPDILSRAGHLLAHHARHGEPIYPGQVYVAPPDYHMTVRDGTLELSHGARENMHRPAIDPLFRSAARSHGPRVIGVVLTGALFDGVAGLMAIRAAGGLAVVQDPEDAPFAALPRNAAEIAGADHTVPASELAALLTELVHRPVSNGESRTMSDPMEKMPEIVDKDMHEQEQGGRRGNVSVFTCPECGGALWQVPEQDLVRFRCHVGHAYYAEALLTEQADGLEAALWTAVRIFKERVVLARQLASKEKEAGKPETAARFEDQAQVAERYGSLIQQYLLQSDPPSGGTEEENVSPP